MRLIRQWIYTEKSSSSNK